MLAAARLSRDKLGADLLETHETLRRAAGLPPSVPSVNAEAVLTAMGRDKKRKTSDPEDEYRFVLLEGVGHPVRDVPVSADAVRRAIGDVLEP